MENTEGTNGHVKSPTDFLKSIKGKTVLVKLNSGVDYKGASHSTPILLYY